MTATPAKDRKAAERARKRAAGLVQLEVWVRPEHATTVMLVAQISREMEPKPPS